MAVTTRSVSGESTRIGQKDANLAMTAVLEPVLAATALPRLPSVVRGYDGPRMGPTSDDFKAFRETCEFLATARSAIQPEYQRRPADVGMLLLRAKALNIEVGVALDHIYINAGGTSGLSAQLIAYLLRRAGINWDDTKTSEFVELNFYREYTITTRAGRKQTRKKRLGTVRFDMDEARAAIVTRNGRSVSLANTYHWRTWPIPCMWARAMSRAARSLFTAITLGMSYTPEEFSDGTGADTPAAAVSVDDAPVEADVEELIQQALSEDATPDLIRFDIMARAKKAELLGKHAGHGLTLEETLVQIWDMKIATSRDREMTLAADAAMVAAGYTAPASWADRPVGEGKLPCGCPATVLLTDEHDKEVCTGDF